MNCPNCGTPIAPGDVFCSNCGTPFQQVQQGAQQGRTCPTCGSPAAPNDAVCRSCGSAIDPYAAQMAGGATGGISKSTILALSGMGVVAVMAIALAFWWTEGFGMMRSSSSATATPTAKVAQAVSTATTAPVLVATATTSGATVAVPTATSRPAQTPTTPPTVSPTPTSKPAATATIPSNPAAQLEAGRSLLHRDTFDDSGSGFATSSGNPSVYNMGYRAGEYEMTAIASGKNTESTWAGVYLARDFTNFSVGLDARMATDARNGAYGLLVRFRDYDNYYKMEVDPYMQSFKVKRLVNNSEKAFVDWTNSGVINKGTAVNRLFVVAKGTKLDWYINGVKVASADDSSFSSGSIGMMINAWLDPVVVRYDNLAVYQE